MEILRCPICKKTLKKEAKSYVCEARHCFDIAKSGYVNLLPPNKKKTPLPGDNAEMIAARSALMDCGYYDSLIAAILKLLSSKPSGNLLDIGCGEGIITQKIKERYPEINILGVDISKFAANAAAKRCPDNLYVVASITSLPAADGSIDTILNAFAPIDLPEANRVLSESGSIIKVVPGPNHLWGLKRLLYETPYKNPEESFFPEGFTLKEKITATDVFCAKGKMIESLLQMTPYFYKTSKESIARIIALDEVKTELEFSVMLFSKAQ